jgi:hypothetical protein
MNSKAVSKSPREKASKPRLTLSTFSCDTARAVSRVRDARQWHKPAEGVPKKRARLRCRRV